jgi:hypothetical protein
MLLAWLFLSCNPIKEIVSTETQMPSLAALGKKDKALLNSDFKQVGEPIFTKNIALSATAVRFTKSKFKAYQNYKIQKGEKVYVKYVDSLPRKPKYFQFEIKDLIGLKALLNNHENVEVRSYLTKDADCQIVSGISVYMDEMEADMYLRAQGLFLTTDQDGMLQLELINGKRKQYVNLPKNDVFDYELIGFCWGKNVYGKPQIETLNNGKCSAGTEKNAQELDNLKSFLKL